MRYKNNETRRVLAYLLSVYAVGAANAKKVDFFRRKLLEEYGYNVGKSGIAKTLASHPRVGFIDSRHGGYYLITTRAEADKTAEALEKRAQALSERAAHIRALYPR